MNDKKIREELLELCEKAEDAKGRPEELMIAIFGPVAADGDEWRHLTTVEELRATGNKYIKDRMELDKEIETAKNKLAALKEELANINEVQKINENLEKVSYDFAKTNRRKHAELRDRKDPLRKEIERLEVSLYGGRGTVTGYHPSKDRRGFIAHEYRKKVFILREEVGKTEREVDSFLYKHSEALVERYIPEIDFVQHLLTKRGYLDKPGVAKGAWRYPDVREPANESW